MSTPNRTIPLRLPERYLTFLSGTSEAQGETDENDPYTQAVAYALGHTSRKDGSVHLRVTAGEADCLAYFAETLQQVSTSSDPDDVQDRRAASAVILQTRKDR